MRKETKDLINKRKIAFVYLMHRMFEGNPTMMLKIMRFNAKVTLEDLQDWDLDYKDAVYQTIQEEDTNGVKLRDQTDVPSIKSIKEKVLRRCDVLINQTEDPARLAQVYKTLSEFEVADDKKEKTVLDAINESIKPLTKKKKEEMITLMDKIKKEKFGGKSPKKKVVDYSQEFAGLNDVPDEDEEMVDEEIDEQVEE